MSQPLQTGLYRSRHLYIIWRDKPFPPDGSVQLWNGQGDTILAPESVCVSIGNQTPIVSTEILGHASSAHGAVFHLEHIQVVDSAWLQKHDRGELRAADYV